MLARYGRFVRELAAQEGVMAADLNAPVTTALRRAESLDPESARQIIPDRIHPAPAGHLLLAAALLKAWSAPRVVTAVTIDAARPRVTRQENTRVWQLRGGERLSWTQWDDALPMPLDRNDPVLRLALGASDVIEALDQQPLQVTDLPAQRYRLTVDGETVGSFWREELARGVNLALLPTPMARQAAEVHELTLRHHEIHFVRWRQVQVLLQARRLRALAPALRALDALEDELIRQQRAAAQPRPHQYELAPEPRVKPRDLPVRDQRSARL